MKDKRAKNKEKEKENENSAKDQVQKKQRSKMRTGSTPRASRGRRSATGRASRGRCATNRRRCGRGSRGVGHGNGLSNGDGHLRGADDLIEKERQGEERRDQ